MKKSLVVLFLCGCASTPEFNQAYSDCMKSIRKPYAGRVSDGRVVDQDVLYCQKYAKRQAKVIRK